MKKLFLAVLCLFSFSHFAFGQIPTYTPNLHLELPPTGFTNWDQVLNSNFSIIDTAVAARPVIVGTIRPGNCVAFFSPNELQDGGPCGGGGGGSSLLSSFQFGSNTAITGMANFLQLTASGLFSLTQSGLGTFSNPFVDTIGLASQSANCVIASPNGAPGVPACRGLVAADVPPLAYVTSVGVTVPSWLSVSGSPITSSGTFGITAATGQTSHQVLGTCGTATSFAPCTLGTGDLPSTVVTSIVNDTNVTGSILGQVLTLGWSGTLAAGRLNSNVVEAVTNDTNITGSILNQNLTLAWSGTLAAGRLNSNVVQSFVNDTNITATILNQVATLGWSGTLAAGRLNANVVQSFVNDTNITATILNQVATLAWSGTLAAARLNSNVVQGCTNDTNVTCNISAQNLTLGWTGTLAKGRTLATTVYTDQANTYSSGLQDFSSVTLKLPSSSGFAASASSMIGLDTTAKNIHALANSVDAYLFSGPASGTYTNGDCVKFGVSAGYISLVDTGSACGSGGGSGTINNASQFSLPYYSSPGSANTLSGVAPTSSPNGVPCVWFTLYSSGSPTAPQCNLQGVPVNASLGTSPYVNLVTDRGSLLLGNPSSSFPIDLPNPTTSGFGSNFVEAFKNYGTAPFALTPPMGINLNGAASALNLPGNWTAFLWSDNSNLWVSRLPDFSAFPDCQVTAIQFVQATGTFQCPASFGNSALANSSITVNGVTCTLGGSCNPGGSGGQVDYPINYPIRVEPVGLSLTQANTVANTAMATSIIGSKYAGRNYVPAGAMLPDAGGTKTLRLYAVGTLGTAAILPTLTVNILLGGQTLSSISVPLITGLSNDGWELNYTVTITSLTTASVGGCIHVTGTSSADMVGCASNASVSGLNFATLQNLDLQVVWGTADPANTFTVNDLLASPAHAL